MNKKILKNIEWGILICCVILLCIGLVALFSATNDTEFDELKKQVLWAAMSYNISAAVSNFASQKSADQNNHNRRTLFYSSLIQVGGAPIVTVIKSYISF